MIKKPKCLNFNHSKANPQVSFCSHCGERFNKPEQAPKNCNDEKHREARKNRNLYCVECGKDLAK